MGWEEGLGDGEELDFEDEGGTTGDAGLVDFAVGLLCGNVDFPFVAGMHLLHCYDPTGNEVAESEGGGYSSTATVEGLAVDGFTDVVGGYDATAVGGGFGSVSFFQYFVAYAFIEHMYVFFL